MAFQMAIIIEHMCEMGSKDTYIVMSYGIDHRHLRCRTLHCSIHQQTG